nr:MAG TPA: hypothetical protein [Caudoviricetes sp.]
MRRESTSRLERYVIVIYRIIVCCIVFLIVSFFVHGRWSIASGGAYKSEIANIAHIVRLFFFVDILAQIAEDLDRRTFLEELGDVFGGFVVSHTPEKSRFVVFSCVASYRKTHDRRAFLCFFEGNVFCEVSASVNGWSHILFLIFLV